MNIKAPSVFATTGNLSGGNQQKVVLSKWIFADPDVLILDEPTRGIDVGAKYEIYTVINDLAAQGKAVIVISSELPELLGMCDRIYTMDEGRLTGEVAREDATQETLMRHMMKGRTEMTTTPTVNTPASAPAPPPPDSPAAPAEAALQGNIRQYGMLVALALIVILFQVWTDGILLKPLNVTNLVQQNGYILILAIGMMIVIIAGHIDLSVGSLAGFIGAMSAVLMIRHDMPWPVAVVLCLLLGALIGAWQGFWIAYVGIPSFIVTLAGMLLFRGATQILLEGQSIAPFPRSFGQVSSGFLPEIGGSSLYHWPTIILGVLVMFAAVWQQVRQRKTQTQLRLRRAAAGLVRRQVRRDRRRARRLHPAAGQLPRRAGRRHHPRGAVRHLRLRDAQHGLRPAGLRDRRQRGGGQAVRRQDQARHLPGLRQHGPAGGAGRSGVRGPPQLGHAAGGHRTSNWRPSPRRSSAARRPAAVSAPCSAPSSAASSSAC